MIKATRACCIDTDLVVSLEVGGTLYVPLSRFPRLEQATPAQRQNVHICGGGIALRWPDLDEDLSIQGLFRF